MIIEKNTNNQFLTVFNVYPVIGFHATTSLASDEIEKIGFLPNKIFIPEDHNTIISEAKSLQIDTSCYEQWLEMRSVTFTNNQTDALNHIKKGSSGGQGLGNALSVLQAIASSGSAQQNITANNFINRINNIRNSSSVIYAVDLSSIGQRLVKDSKQAALYQIYFDKNAPLPSVSIVTPQNIIARLDVF